MAKPTTTQPSQRMLRVGELVRHALSNFLMRNEIQDPDLFDRTVTVPEVRMTPDLKIANCYVMPLGGGDAEDVVAALNRNRKFIRGQVTRDIELKFAPDLKFFVDQTFDEADRITELLRSDRVQQDLDDDGGETGDGSDDR